MYKLQPLSSSSVCLAAKSQDLTDCDCKDCSTGKGAPDSTADFTPPQLAFPAADNPYENKGNASTLHHRLCHFNMKGMPNMLKKGLVRGLKLSADTDLAVKCPACSEGMMSSHPFKASEVRATRPMAVVHADLFGPCPPTMPNHP
jgi:hypothetical protein